MMIHNDGGFVKLRKKLFKFLVDYEIGEYKDNIDGFYKNMCDVYKELYELIMIMQGYNRCISCGDDISDGCLYCPSCMEEAEKTLLVINNE